MILSSVSQTVLLLIHLCVILILSPWRDVTGLWWCTPIPDSFSENLLSNSLFLIMDCGVDFSFSAWPAGLVFIEFHPVFLKVHFSDFLTSICTNAVLPQFYFLCLLRRTLSDSSSRSSMKNRTDTDPEQKITVLFHTFFRFDSETIITILCGDVYSPIFMSSDNYENVTGNSV